MAASPPERADACTQADVRVAEMATQATADAQAEAAEAKAEAKQLRERLEALERVRREADYPRLFRLAREGIAAKLKLEQVSQQLQQLQQQQEEGLQQQQQQQQQQPARTGDDRAPKRALEDAPCSSATRVGVDYATAARGAAGGDGARTPPAEALEEAGDALAAESDGSPRMARGGGSGRGIGDGRGCAQRADGGGRGGASSSKGV